MRPFSLFLIASQFVTTCSAVVGVDVAEDVRMAVDELVVHAARHVGQVELPGLVGQAGVEDDLEQQVPQLLLQVRVGLGVGVIGREPSGLGQPRPARRGPRSSPRPGAA